MGAIRNVGFYEMFLWFIMRPFGSTAKFPLNNLHILEELVTIAAVDTIGEAERGAKRRADNDVTIDENRTHSHFRTRRASSVATTIFLYPSS